MQKKSRAERRRSDKLSTRDRTLLRETIKTFLSLKHPVTRFCVVFSGLLITFSLLVFQKAAERHCTQPITGFIASHAAWILKALGLNVAARGITITGEGFSVEILGNCNAVFETGLYLSAVIAFPAMLKEKIVGAVLGTVFIYGLNLLRVVLLFLVGIYAPQHFEASHVYIAQSIFIVAVAFCWLFWAGKWIKGTTQ